MSSTASAPVVVGPAERVEVLFEELAELAGQRNAVDGRIVEIVAELNYPRFSSYSVARAGVGWLAVCEVPVRATSYSAGGM
jgi:hypothetical protein